MRAPSAEVLQRHWEDVHQTSLEKVVENSGSIGHMTRVAYRKIRRSMSLKPQALASAADGPRPDDGGEKPPTAAPPLRKSTIRRSSLPPPKAAALDTGDSLFAGRRWRQHAAV